MRLKLFLSVSGTVAQAASEKQRMKTVNILHGVLIMV
jgi:hypothetical protein